MLNTGIFSDQFNVANAVLIYKTDDETILITTDQSPYHPQFTFFEKIIFN